jgi:acyl carrier protein
MTEVSFSPTGLDRIEKRLIKVVLENFNVDSDEITRDTHFVNDLNADSLDVVQLIMGFEDEFEMSIPEGEVEGLQTFGEAVDYIREFIKERERRGY